MAGTIAAGVTLSNRPQLLAAINRNGLAVDAAVDVAVLASPATNYLLAAPELRILGEQK